MSTRRRILRSGDPRAASLGPPALRFRRVGKATLEEARACACEAGRQLRAWGLPEERVARWELAVAEMATNVARHGYAGCEPGLMVLDISWEPEGLTIALLDEGLGFDPSIVLPPQAPDPRDPETWPEGGMGLMLVRTAGDRLSYCSRGGQNVLSLFSAIERR